jgi:hypothetical protein
MYLMVAFHCQIIVSSPQFSDNDNYFEKPLRFSSSAKFTANYLEKVYQEHGIFERTQGRVGESLV